MGNTPSFKTIQVVPSDPDYQKVPPKKKKRPKKFNRTELKIMRQYLPSFVYAEHSTEEHRHLAHVHWEKVFNAQATSKKESSTKIMELYDTFYAYLEDNYPELKPVFRSSLHVRGRVLVHISAGMRTLLAHEKFMDRVHTLTSTHMRFGVKLEHFDQVGCALIYAMKETSGSAWTPEIENAWRHMFSHCSVILIRAQKARTKKRPSNVKTQSHRGSLDISGPILVSSGSFGPNVSTTNIAKRIDTFCISPVKEAVRKLPGSMVSLRSTVRSSLDTAMFARH